MVLAVKWKKKEIKASDRSDAERQVEIFVITSCKRNEKRGHDEQNEVVVSVGLGELTEKDMEAQRWFPSNPDGVSASVFCFSSRGTRDEWLSEKTILRETETGIYLQERLTAQNRKLFRLTQSKTGEKHFQVGWRVKGSYLYEGAVERLLSW